MCKVNECWYCAECHGRTSRREYNVKVRIQAAKRCLLNDNSVGPDLLKALEYLDDCLDVLPKGDPYEEPEMNPDGYEATWTSWQFDSDCEE